MSEEEWLACDDPTPMLKFLQYRAGERRLRLLGVAIARASWDRLEDERSRRAVAVTEQFVDGAVGASALEAVVNDAWDVRDELWDAGPASHDDRLWLAEAAAFTASLYEWRNMFVHPGPSDDYPFRLSLPAHCELIRDIFGNPFRPVAFDPRWRTADVVGLARGIYEDRAFDRMPLLADALMDAACDSEEILNHCRSDGPHVRGCWVVDVVLSKV